jgi:hypothetical protein
MWCDVTSHRWKLTRLEQRFHVTPLSGATRSPIFDYRERTCQTCARVEYYSVSTQEWRWGGKFATRKGRP